MAAKVELREIKKLLEAGGLAELGPGPRKGAMSELELEGKLEALLNKAALPDSSVQLIRSLLLLWHDHLDASHTISQVIENTDGGFVHGIMHRREPDYGNAACWFRRVGRHGAFPELAKRAGELLEAKREGALKKELKEFMPRGEWDALAFIDACEKVAGKSVEDERVLLLREIQRIETEALLEWFLI